MAVAHLQGVRNAALALLLRDLIHAVAELGHLYPVCESYIFHKKFLLFGYGSIIAPFFAEENLK